MNEAFFQKVAHYFPTQKIQDSPILYTLWRGFFYALRPHEPFYMKTKYYSFYAHPRKGNLSRTVARRGVWERNQTNLFVQRLKRDMIFIDAGANFGHYSLIASNFIGPQGKVYAFEPEPSTFSQLKQNISLSENDNILIFSEALGNENTQLDFYIDLDNPGGHSLNSSNLIKLKETIKVNCHRLDDFLEKIKLNRLDFIKLDTQGAEGAIIEGGFSSIKKHHPTIFCEFEPQSLANAGYEPQALLEKFFSLDYVISYIDSHSPNKLQSISSSEFKLTKGKYDLVIE